MNLLSIIQSKLDAPKSQYNKYGKFNYRNVEDINNGLKPLIEEHGFSVKTTTEAVIVGSYHYIKAIATLKDKDNKIIDESVGWSREPDEKKGMAPEQVTGSAQSYAKKYALCGLFAIDDDKDADTFDNTSDDEKAEDNEETKKEAKVNLTGDFVIQVRGKHKDKKVKDIKIQDAANTFYFYKHRVNEAAKHKFKEFVDNLNNACVNHYGVKNWEIAVEKEKQKHS